MAGGGQQQRLIRKIQKACNVLYGEQLLYNINQFYSPQQKREINRYVLLKQIDNPDTGKSSREELYSTYSLINMVCFIRDYWYLLNGLDLPDDNKRWSELRKETILVNGSITKKERIDGRKENT